MSNDSLVWLEGEDPEMVSAITRAQQAFPEFAAELEREAHRLIPALDCAIVKAFFPHPDKPKAGEHMFVDQLKIVVGMIHGRLSGTPQYATHLREGQRVSFPVANVSDWFYVVRGKGQGGHTLDVIARKMSEAEYREAAKSPPFSWFAWRGHGV